MRLHLLVRILEEVAGVERHLEPGRLDRLDDPGARPRRCGPVPSGSPARARRRIPRRAAGASRATSITHLNASSSLWPAQRGSIPFLAISSSNDLIVPHRPVLIRIVGMPSR